MAEEPKLAIFDVDGTIAMHGEIPKSVLDGLKHLHHKGYITTVSTGNGYIRLKELFGDLFELIISPDALIIVEHGTKIVNRQGKIIFGEFFNAREIDHIADFTRANINLYKLAWFNPVDVNRKVQVWCIDEKDVEEETKKRGHYANVFTCSIGEWEDLLLTERLTNVTLRFKDYVKVENLKLAFTRTDTNVIFQDSNMEYVKNNTNKGLAAEYVSRRLKVKKENMLIAGNAINDVEMLDIGTKIAVLVSEGDERSTILSYLSQPETVIKVNTPHDLGNYLLSL